VTEQLAFALPRPKRRRRVPTRGGKRPGAGRKRVRPLPEGWKAGRTFVPHLRRVSIDARRPAHITLRLRPVVRTLRNGRHYKVVHAALGAGAERRGFRLVHYSVQRDHLHLIVEADDRRALARGMQGLNIRIARRLNRALKRSGPVLADRYHARVLGSPTEVRRALLYVLNNARHHAAQGRATYPQSWIDPFSSAADFDGWSRPVFAADETLERCTAAPRSSVLRGGWRRAGLLDPAAVPGPTPAPAYHA
jgi:REP element-mobilizing transposase RayT